MRRKSTRKPKEKRTPPSAFDKAVDLLARRQQTTAEIRRKLKQREYEAREIEETIARLTELRYLDDDRTAADWAAELSNRGGLGRRRAEEKMIRRGLLPAAVRRELDDVWSDRLERENALKLARKWIQVRRPDLSEISERRRLARFLAGKGFNAETVWRAVNEVARGEDDPDR